MALLGTVLASAATAWGGVTYSLDSGTTTSSTLFPGTPALSLAVPSQGNVYEGGGANGGVEGIVFLATSSFNLGAIEFQGVGGPANLSLSLYNLGTSVSASNPRYTIDGSSVNLFTPGLNVNISAATDSFHVLTFSGADQVSLTSGNWYAFELLDNDPANAFLVRRASTGLDSFLSLGTGATGARNNVPAGDRDPVAAVYAAAPVPEPSSLALIGGGIGALFATRRFKRA